MGPGESPTTVARRRTTARRRRRPKVSGWPACAASRVLRGKMIDALKLAYRRSTFAGFCGFDHPDGFARLVRTIAKLCGWCTRSDRSRTASTSGSTSAGTRGAWRSRTAGCSRSRTAASPSAPRETAPQRPLLSSSYAVSCNTSCPTGSTRSATSVYMPAPRNAPWLTSYAGPSSHRLSQENGPSCCAHARAVMSRAAPSVALHSSPRRYHARAHRPRWRREGRDHQRPRVGYQWALVGDQ
jgi:hypothetical protein